jgi:hypothetical protein
MRQDRKTLAVAVAVAAVLVGGGAYAAVSIGDDSPAEADGDGGQPGTAPTAAEAEQVAEAFLGAWADGFTGPAADLTDDPPAVRAALTAFTEDAGLTGLTLTPGSAAPGEDGTAVPFSVRGSVAHGELTADWSYDSELTVVRAEGGEPVVDWRPEVRHPRLTEGRTVELGPPDGPGAVPVRVLDSSGEELTAEDHPTLAGLLDQLRERYAEESGGAAGVVLRVTGEDAGGTDDGEDDGEEAAEEPLLTLAEPATGEVPTTIDRKTQRAAEKALADTPRAAMVAIEPSSGAIRAVVNNPAGGEDMALQGRNSPGSTWKIVTSGMLLEEGLADPDAAHPCPKFFDHGGWEFQNLNEFEIKGGTFADSFAASCNTAFISTAPKLEDDQLGAYAKKAFGVGLDWKTGVDALSGSVPVEEKAQKAAQLIGQAGVLVNPLVMASVSATVKEGAFHQPYLVPPEFDGRELARAEGPSAEAAGQLRRLMKLTASSGTAAAAMAGLGGDIGGKTGSAEVYDQKKPNAWFTAFRNDLAVAAVVPNSGHGGKFAGPLVVEVLKAAG